MTITPSQQLKSYKPAPNPVIPGGDSRYLSNELQRISNVLTALVAATKNVDDRLTAAGF